MLADSSAVDTYRITMTKQGIVIKSVGGVFTVCDRDNVKTICYSPKKFRYKSDDVIIGDIVRFEDLKRGKGVICEVLPRKSKLTRPEIANVDVCLIVVACEPQPDFYLVDKVLINCFQQGIDPIIVVNKTDLGPDVYEQATANFGNVTEVVAVSAINDTARVLGKYFTDGKVVCFAGQSAVGKTSLLNALLPLVNGEVGELSQKTGRGMHTTRHATLHKLLDGFVADTCGFSLLDLKDIKSSDLRLYLDDFVAISRNCRFSSCTHTVEPDCAVKLAVEQGKLNPDRYKRYVDEYNDLVEFEKRQF